MAKKIQNAQIKAIKFGKLNPEPRIRKLLRALDDSLPEFCWTYRRKVGDFWYNTKCLLKPKHKAIRKAIPKTWADITYLIVEVNFALIKDFYHEEAVAGFVDWNATKECKEFYSWLKRTVKYIEKDRPALEKQMNDAYPDYGPDFSVDQINKGSYKELYGEVNRLETLIHRKDTKLLKEMIDYRDYFWT